MDNIITNLPSAETADGLECCATASATVKASNVMLQMYGKRVGRVSLFQLGNMVNTFEIVGSKSHPLCIRELMCSDLFDIKSQKS